MSIDLADVPVSVEKMKLLASVNAGDAPTGHEGLSETILAVVSATLCSMGFSSVVFFTFFALYDY